MIGQNSNNKATGYTAKECDAGLPISGRTSSTGTYEIIKTLDDGTLIVQQPLSDSVLPYAMDALNVATPGGAIGAGIIVAKQQITSSAIEAGLYKITPYYVMDGNAGGAVNIVLFKLGTTIATYAATRTPFTDTFAPSITDMNTGFAYLWHSITMQSIGGTMRTAYNLNLTAETFLEAGQYVLLVYVHTAITQNATSQYIGVQQFTRIG